MYWACASLTVLSGQLDSVSLDIPNVCGITLINLTDLLLFASSDLLYGEHQVVVYSLSKYESHPGIELSLNVRSAHFFSAYSLCISAWRSAMRLS
jgi:hypothetical protein